MEKVLRSLIHEKFPFDLRVQIDLLARRHGGDDKQTEIVELVRNSGIDITPLGPGTNRYAFRLDGFVVKVATDHDGKIDNLKEFKMAKILFPYVTKTYEVSDNGSLLVAEYIQSFSSYSEMLTYADEIKSILRKLSKMYLIGDVGVSSKNYGNWGIRPGTNKPVCLDYAYVYEISSELFICKNCETNSMLVPNEDFTSLFCPTCKKGTTFETIRTRIGNDIHNHEIGDLSEVGYKLKESNVLTTLIEDKSSYIKEENIPEEKDIKNNEEEFIDNFVMDKPPIYYIKEEKKMGKYFDEAVRVISTMPGKTTKYNRGNVIVSGTAVKHHNEQDNMEVQEEDPSVVVGTAYVRSDVEQTNVVDKYIDYTNERTCTVVKAPEAPVTVTRVISAKINSDVETTAESPAVHMVPKTVVNKAVDKTDDKPVKEPVKNSVLSNRFLENTQKAISTIANKMGEYTHFKLLFDDVKSHIKDKKMYPETFYRSISTAAYNSFIAFLNLRKEQVQNKNNNKYQTNLYIDDPEGHKYLDTLIFIDRFWTSTELNQKEDFEELMDLLRKKYPDGKTFIQKEYIAVFRQNVKRKLPVCDATGINIIVKSIEEFWCNKEDLNEQSTDNTDTPTDMSSAIDIDNTTEDITENLSEEPAEGLDEQTVAALSALEDDEDGDDEGDQEEESTEDDPYEEYLNVEIHHSNIGDTIIIKSFDEVGKISIPIYLNGSIKDQKCSIAPSIADERNEKHDWLIHMIPDIKFLTDDPNKWLPLNDQNDHIRFVILDSTRNDGKVLMALFYFLGFYDVIDGSGLFVDDENMLDMLNKIIKTHVALNGVSRYQHTINLIDSDPDEQLKSEEFIYDWLNKYMTEQAYDSMIDDSEEPAEGLDEQTVAALSALEDDEDGDDEGDQEEESTENYAEQASGGLTPIRRKR